MTSSGRVRTLVIATGSSKNQANYFLGKGSSILHLILAWMKSSPPSGAVNRASVLRVAIRTLIIALVAGNGVFGQSLPTPVAPKAFQTVSPANRNLDSSLYMQTAAEYRASCYQAYNLATARLKEAFDKRKAEKPPAVVMDLDETVFDNSAFQALLVRSGLAWDPRLWEAWERDNSDKITLIPGAKEFVVEARRLGVSVIFVSNRDEEFKKQTEEALKRLSIPVDNNSLLKLKPKNAGDDKTS
jgi:5'-nucleotidase (lipoprotein e(P4) family)